MGEEGEVEGGVSGVRVGGWVRGVRVGVRLRVG